MKKHRMPLQYVDRIFPEKKMDMTVVLGKKVLEELQANIRLSMNVNKKEEELFGGWED